MEPKKPLPARPDLVGQIVGLQAKIVRLEKDLAEVKGELRLTQVERDNLLGDLKEIHRIAPRIYFE
jgi:hypothetical protein